MCGNALLPEDYTRLMGNKRARMIFSDAPYNIYVENNVSGLGKIKHKDFAMASGEMNFDEFKNFLKTFVSHSIAHAVDGALLYLFMDRRHLEELFLAGRETGLKIVDLCIWEKKTGGMGSFYRSQHEPCVIFRVGKAAHLNCIELGRHGRYRTNVWSHPGLGSFGRDRDESLAMHPTVKPVNLLAEAIKDCTRRGDIVLDPFAGSASTIIAAEKTRRIAYAIELDATYVDTGLRRWEKFSGVKAIHEGTGASFDEIRKQRNPATSGLHTQQ